MKEKKKKKSRKSVKAEKLAKKESAKAKKKAARSHRRQQGFIQGLIDRNKVHIEKVSRTQDLVHMLFDGYSKDSDIFWKDGVYSKMYEFADVSFAKANDEDKYIILKKWIEFLHSVSETMHIQVLVSSIPIKREDYKRNFMYDLSGLPENEKALGMEMNDLIERTLGSEGENSLETKRFIIMSMKARDEREARDEFYNVTMKISSKFHEFGSSIRECTYQDRLEVVYNFFQGHKFLDDITDANGAVIMHRGANGKLHQITIPEYAEANSLSVYDVLAPRSADFSSKDYFIFSDGNEKNERYGRIVYVSKLSNTISPQFFNDMMNLNDMDTTISFGITPVASNKAMKTVEHQITSMKTERLDKIKRASKSGYSYDAVRDERLEDRLDDAQQLRHDLQANAQKLFMTNMFMLIKGNTLEELENNTSRVIEKAGEQVVTIDYFNYEQVEGIAQVMPFADNRTTIQRSLTSDATACHLPFNAKEMLQPGSIFYGVNLISKNAVFADRKKLINGNGCILATSGAGKSFSVKMIIEQILMRYPEDNVIVIDPQSEYGGLIKYFGGQEIVISTDSNTHINPFDLDDGMDLDEGRHTNHPIKAKVEYLQAFFDSIVNGGLDDMGKSIIDRCCVEAYQKFEESGFTDETLQPNLPGFYHILKSQPESEAQRLAVSLERYVTGTIDLFSQRTNVNIHNRFVSFNISELPESLQTTGYLVVLDHIMNTLSKNRKLGKSTWIFIDEFHVLLKNRFSAEYIAKIYKVGRKYGALPSVISQNISDILENEQGNKILGNSEFALILKQKPEDLRNVSQIFGISESEQEYVGPDCPPGQGIMVYAKDKIVFRNVVAKDTELYRINNTDAIVQSRN